MRSGGWSLIAGLLALACSANPAVPSAAPSSASTPAAPTTNSVGTRSNALAARTVPAGATAGVDDATWTLVDTLSASNYTTDTTAAMTAALARAGVGTFADTTSPAPEVAITGTASPFELLDFQTHALAVGAWAGTTWSGAELDQVLPIPDGITGVAPTSDVLAGYVAAVATPGAQLARALMAGQDLLNPATVEFPGVVLVLFASDIASASAGSAAPALSPSPAAQVDPRLLAVAQTGPGSIPLNIAADVTGPCSTASAFIHDKIDALFNALKIQAQNSLILAIVAAIWNWIVDKLQEFVENIITTVTSLIFGYVKAIVAEIATVSEQIASVLPFAVTVSVSGPSGDQFDLTKSSGPMLGAYVVTVTAGDLPDWPDIIKDCARVAGLQLPDFHSKNVPLTWGPLEVVAPGDPLLSPLPVGATDAVTDASGTATWSFGTSADPGDKNGPIERQVDIMHVAVHRPELDQIRAALTRALLGFVPPILQDAVLYLIGKLDPAIAGIQSSVNALLDRTGEGAAWFTFHGKNPPTPVPTPVPTAPTPAPSTACATSLPPGSYTGSMTTDILVQTTLAGQTGTTTEKGTGPVTLSVGPDEMLTGTFEQKVTSNDVQHGIGEGSTDEVLDDTGSFSGTICTLTLNYLSETVTSCQATGVGACDGPIGTKVSLVGVALPLPMGLPTHGSGSLVWTLHFSDTTNLDPSTGTSSETSTYIVTIGVP